MQTPALFADIRSKALMAALGLVILGPQAPAQTPKEQVLLSMKDARATEVQSQGFTLPKDMKVHVYAKGGGVEGEPFFAYGWILNAATREVVWQMDGRTAHADGAYQVADATISLPQGSYEAYYAHHAYAQDGAFFMSSSRNLDRRPRTTDGNQDDSHGRWVRRLFTGGSRGHGAWTRRVGNYGMELYLPANELVSVEKFKAPLNWKNEFIALIPDKDGGRWTASFHVRRAVALHVYAQGEYVGDNEFADHGWILDARNRRPVWEMNPGKAQYGGGENKNRRQVETIQLPAGDYIATYTTDGSHSPSDWNAAPPCDPLRYGLILAVPKEGDRSQVELAPAPETAPVLAELVRMGNHQNERRPFTLQAPGKVRVYAIGERGGYELAYTAWIEDSEGKTVWSMSIRNTLHAGGAEKNRVADEVLNLPKGSYTLRVRTDGSHSYSRWNDTAPWDAERYGATVYSVK